MSLDRLSTTQLLETLHQADSSVAQAVGLVLPQIEDFIETTLIRMQAGGRLFYIGAGTSGRLGILDASECPPTFGVPQGLVIGLIAGGDSAIRKAVEFAEDDLTQAWQDLAAFSPTTLDTVLGIAASGRTPYVIGGIEAARQAGLYTGALVCKEGSALAKKAEKAIEVLVGEEVLRGSTRLKAGTAQKMVLNMISTSLMVKLGKVKGDKMIDMQLANHKLIERGIDFICEEIPNLSRKEAGEILLEKGSVRAVLSYFNKI
ncbi:N-acetylmuramic acid 6-phosphate etherase [Hugenholtzia roseola]|uniref:N-acetylmuramic acid 6-phosphate etherase n=1 Tax=Hugenholtzia roseola TaxID=1002 RepID=UPI000405134F|nr:N-acetylmuramic acid 6-phosphate etherase [Hugenholtzia roseola]